MNGSELGIDLKLTPQEAEDVHNALSVAVQLMDEVDVPPHAPLYGARPRLVAVAKRLSHKQRHRGAVPNPNGPVE